MCCISRNFVDVGGTAISSWALGQFNFSDIHIANGTTLPRGCSHIKICSISLILPLYCKGFGKEMGVGERAEFHAATQHHQNRQ